MICIWIKGGIGGDHLSQNKSRNSCTGQTLADYLGNRNTWSVSARVDQRKLWT